MVLMRDGMYKAGDTVMTPKGAGEVAGTGRHGKQAYVGVRLVNGELTTWTPDKVSHLPVDIHDEVTRRARPALLREEAKRLAAEAETLAQPVEGEVTTRRDVR